MSIDIQWESIISGPDGSALAEKIRVFVHDKFQEIPLPRFINAVHVHSFDLGTVCPEIEIKDICDPLPDFYEDDEDDEDQDEDGAQRNEDEPYANSTPPAKFNVVHGNGFQESALPPHRSQRPTNIMTGGDVNRFNMANTTEGGFGLSANPFNGPFPRSTTPGIPGGTSNLGYFNFPGSGLSGTQTPLAAVASGTSFTPRPWLHDPSDNSVNPLRSTSREPIRTKQSREGLSEYHDPSTRPSTANTIASFLAQESHHSHALPAHTTQTAHDESGPGSSFERMGRATPSPLQNRQPSDLQVVTRVKYAGDVRMTLTAEILLDYPMPSFVNIPLKLAITGLSFDGVAVVAWVKKKMNFCFLDPEDAAALVGEDVPDHRPGQKISKDGSTTAMTGLLREIHVESEIGRQADGKQVLKNVGKVEKFVLEQVRKIFEEEFVFPSYWTFLV